MAVQQRNFNAKQCMCSTDLSPTPNDRLLELLSDVDSFFFPLMVVCGSLPDGFGINKCDVFICSAVNQAWQLAVRLKKVLTGAENADISEDSLSQCVAVIYLLEIFLSFYFILGDISILPIREAEKVKRGT